MRLSTLVAILCVALAAGTVLADGQEGQARLLRFADIHGDKIAFVYAGDIWTVAASGGQATRLTSHEGMEIFPKFSPDGQWIAFSGEYSGSRQVYVIPTGGGTPKQLSYYNDVGAMPPRGGFDYRVMDWTRDGKHVLVRANRLPWGVRMGRPYLLPVDGGLEQPLAVPETGGGMLSPDGKVYVYTPIDREWRTWKRHRGGRAQDVWTYDLKKNTARQLTDDPATDNQPVWVGDTIYFTSDREGGRLNLWSVAPSGGSETQVTHHENFDVLWPSAGPERIVYECGGYLYTLRPGGSPQRVPVTIRGDFEQTVPAMRDVSDQIRSYEISSTGKRALFGARGEVWTVPAENGEPRNLTRTPGIREINPIWSPDGRWVAYYSDRNGEYDLYVRPSDGSGVERRVTSDADAWRFFPAWSPDSKKIAFADKKQRFRYVDVASGAVTEVDTARRADITTYGWAPNSDWLVYTKPAESGLGALWLYSLADEKKVQLTDDWSNDYAPVFDPEGRYLYFISDRDWNLEFSGYEFNYFYNEQARIYAATLAADGPALLQPKSDEESIEEKKDGDDDDDGDDKDDKDDKNGDDTETTKIDVAGFTNRVVALPVEDGNYRNLRAGKDGLYFIEGQGPGKIQRFTIESEKIDDVLDGVGAFELSADGKTILYQSRGSYGICKAAPGQKANGKLDLSGMRMRVVPRAEWRQIYRDGWRMVRDWFYDGNMHGVDWKAMGELYEPLVDHVTHRADLDYIFGELGGELGAGHFYVNWGDFPRPERVDGGLLGAELSSHRSGYVRIDNIFPGENWHASFRSPLTVAGVDVNEGDFILAVDGVSTREVANFYALLEGKAGQVVTLRVNGKPSEEGARDEKVTPVRGETNLRYTEWVEQRREMVDRLSGGRIGYIHLPNTAGPGNRELRKWFYPQATKEALIFDARYNGGGFIPDRMIELLTRRQMSYWSRRGIEPFHTPGFAHTGPKACLMNGYSSSGGDAFPYYFRQAGLGKLYGTRTWGGLIGLSGNPGFMDGGSFSIPTFRFIDPNGEYRVENEGVSPDVEVVDRPDLVAAGQDPTLERAVADLLKELEANPPRRNTKVPPPIVVPRDGGRN